MSTPFTKEALTAEITNDPAVLGYAQFKATGDRFGLMGLINAAVAANQVKRTDVMAVEVLQAIDIRDLAFPGTGQVAVANQPLATAWFNAAVSQPKIRFVNEDGTDTQELKNFKLLVVSPGNGSQARLVALSTRNGSRAEALWGAGFTVSEQMVADAGF